MSQAICEDCSELVNPAFDWVDGDEIYLCPDCYEQRVANEQQQ